MEISTNGVKKTAGLRTFMLPNIVLTLVLAGIEITPYLMRNFSNSIHLMLVPLWVLSASFAYHGKLPFDRDKVIFWTVLWFVIRIVWRVAGISVLAPIDYLLDITVYIIPFVMIYTLEHYTEREKTILKNGILVIVLVNLVSNISLFAKDPSSFIRLGVSGSASRLTNAGDTTFVGLCMFLIGIMLIELLNSKQIKLKIVYLAIIGVSGYYIVFQNTRGTAFIILVVMVCLILLSSFREYEGNKTLKMVIRVFLFAILAIAVVIPLLELSSSTLDFFGLGDKLGLVSDVLQGNTSILEGGVSSFSQRFQLMTAGITTFFSSLSNFFIGVGEDYYGTLGYLGLVQRGVSNHSEIIDAFTFFGIIGGTIKLTFIYQLLKKCVNVDYSERIKRQVIAFAAIIVVYSFLNKIIHANLMYILFIYFPLAIEEMENKTRGRE